MKIAVIGHTGQLARALTARAANHGHIIDSFGRADIDLRANAEQLSAFINGLKDVDALIIAAAYTAVDAAETDTDTAHAVNAHAPQIIAKACQARKLPLVHISTDYVFDGHGTYPYPTDHPTAPVNTYGTSKRAGEIGIIESGAIAAVIRTSWVYDGTGQNFLTTMLRLAQTRTALNIVGDQIGRPTYAVHLADAALTCAQGLVDRPSLTSGIYHVSDAGEPMSWADFARYIFDQGHDFLPHPVKVTDIPSADYPTPAGRPLYSVLDLSRYEQLFGALPTWQSGVNAALNAYRQAQMDNGI